MNVDADTLLRDLEGKGARFRLVQDWLYVDAAPIELYGRIFKNGLTLAAALRKRAELPRVPPPTLYERAASAILSTVADPAARSGYRAAFEDAVAVYTGEQAVRLLREVIRRGAE